jgi:hypothetical protein
MRAAGASPSSGTSIALPPPRVNLFREHQGTIVLTGAPADRRVVDLARSALHGVPFVDASGAWISRRWPRCSRSSIC